MRTVAPGDRIVSSPNTKPYMKLAGTLVMLGMAIFFFERYGLSHMQQGAHLDGWLISVLVIAPVVLVLSGCAVFIVGRMRRL